MKYCGDCGQSILNQTIETLLLFYRSVCTFIKLQKFPYNFSHDTLRTSNTTIIKIKRTTTGRTYYQRKKFNIIIFRTTGQSSITFNNVTDRITIFINL